MSNVMRHDCHRHFGCPMFLTEVEAGNFLEDAYDEPDRFEVQSVDLHGPLWIITPKPKAGKLYTVKVLVPDCDAIDNIISKVHREFLKADCSIANEEEVEIGEDYKWDCSFFEGEKC
jgi:hypothetical protein